MDISNRTSINFNSAVLNIVSTSDNHGDILGIPQVIKTIQENRKDFFEKKDNKSTQNILAIAGDYFMNPAKKGVLTDKDATFGDLQYSLFSTLVNETRKLLSKNNFHALYTPGNHCYGGGDEWLYNKLLMQRIPNLNLLLSNINLQKSPVLGRVMQNSELIKTEKIIEIPDNKNPKLKNHVLCLGVTTPSMYYHPKGFKYTEFYDKTPKDEYQITKNDLKETIEFLNKRIKKFKSKHPRGAVVLLSHTGNKVSSIFAQNVKDINLILNGHDHKDFNALVNGTQILSHGQNNNFIVGTNLRFDDNGKLCTIKTKQYQTNPYITTAKKDKHIQKILKRLIGDDLKPLVYLDDEIKESTEFMFSNKIRYKNSPLANLITSAIKTAVIQKHSDIDVVGITASIIRSGLKSKPQRTTFNNIDLFDMFKGVDANIEGLSKGIITGDELLKLVFENVRNNLKSPTRKVLIHWSDIQVDRTKIENIISSKHKVDLTKVIKIRNKKTGMFEEINPNKKYCILLPEKYLIKNNSSIKVPAIIRHKFANIAETYYELFKEYINMNNGEIHVTDEIMEKRIL